MPNTRSVDPAELEKKRAEVKEEYRKRWESAVNVWASDMAKEEHITSLSSFDPRDEEGKAHAELRKALIVKIASHVLSEVKTDLLQRYDQAHELVGLKGCLSDDWLTAYMGRSLSSLERLSNQPGHINFKLDLHPDVPAKNVRQPNVPPEERFRSPWERQLSLSVMVQSQGKISPGTKKACLTSTVPFESHTLRNALADIRLALRNDPTRSAEVRDSIDALPDTYWNPFNWWSWTQGRWHPENFCVGVALTTSDREDLSSYRLHGYGWYLHPSRPSALEDVTLPILTQQRRGSSSIMTRTLRRSEDSWDSDIDGSTTTLVDNLDEEDRYFVG